MQCREILCNVGAAFAAASYYQKINRFKIKIAEKWCCSDDIRFFPVQCYLESLGQHCTEFLLVQCCPKSITTLLNRNFSCECFLEALGQHCTRFLHAQCCPKTIKTTLNRIYSWVMFFWRLLSNIAQGFYLCNVVPRVLRQHWTGFFSVQHSIAPGFYLCNVVPVVLRQHWTVFIPV